MGHPLFVCSCGELRFNSCTSSTPGLSLDTSGSAANGEAVCLFGVGALQDLLASMSVPAVCFRVFVWNRAVYSKRSG